MATRRPPQLPSVGVIAASIYVLTLVWMFVTILLWLDAVGPAEAAEAYGRPLPAGWEACWQPRPSSPLERWRLGTVNDHPIRFGVFVAVFIAGVAIGFLPRFTRREEPKPVPFPGGENGVTGDFREAG